MTDSSWSFCVLKILFECIIFYPSRARIIDWVNSFPRRALGTLPRKAVDLDHSSLLVFKTRRVGTSVKALFMRNLDMQSCMALMQWSTNTCVFGTARDTTNMIHSGCAHSYVSYASYAHNSTTWAAYRSTWLQYALSIWRSLFCSV